MKKFVFQIADKSGFGVGWTTLKKWVYFGAKPWAWFLSVCLFDDGPKIIHGQEQVVRIPKRIQVCAFGLLISIPLSLKKTSK